MGGVVKREHHIQKHNAGRGDGDLKTNLWHNAVEFLYEGVQVLEVSSPNPEEIINIGLVYSQIVLVLCDGWQE